MTRGGHPAWPSKQRWKGLAALSQERLGRAYDAPPTHRCWPGTAERDCGAAAVHLPISAAFAVARVMEPRTSEPSLQPFAHEQPRTNAAERHHH